MWRWAAWVLLGILVAWLTGRLETHFVPDSASYLDYPFASASEMARSIRTPGYPTWLWAIRSTLGIAWVPAAQVVLHTTAVFWLCEELRRWRMPPIQVIAVGIAVAVGCTPSMHIDTIASDAPAASIGVLVVAAVMRWVRLRWCFDLPGGVDNERALTAAAKGGSAYGAVVLFATAVIMFRPAYLFVVPWIAVTVPLLARMRGAVWGHAVRQGLLAAIPVAVFLLGWMGFRFWAVGDFGILPFGHQNLSGVLVQLVSDEELRGLEEESPMAAAVLDQKTRFLQQDNSFAEGDAGATMTIEARWDAMTYQIVVPASHRIGGDDSVARHDAIAELNAQIVRRYPLRYLEWLAKAARRGAWGIVADIVMHPVFLLAIVTGSAGAVWNALRRTEVAWTFSRPLAWRALTVITATYLVAKLGFVILSSPAIGRFSDAAAIFLPGWFAATYFSFRPEPNRQAGDPAQASTQAGSHP